MDYTKNEINKAENKLLKDALQLRLKLKAIDEYNPHIQKR